MHLVRLPIYSENYIFFERGPFFVRNLGGAGEGWHVGNFQGTFGTGMGDFTGDFTLRRAVRRAESFLENQ